MRENFEEYNTKRRLKAVRKQYVFFPKECECCGDMISKEKMWKVDRWGVNKTVHTWHYCQKCMSTPEDVLNEVDTDSCHFGIAFVDSFLTYQKKDYTKMNEQRDSILRCITNS